MTEQVTNPDLALNLIIFGVVLILLVIWLVNSEDPEFRNLHEIIGGWFSHAWITFAGKTGYLAIFTLIGIYVALFGLASQRYENHLDRIENRANGIFAQLGSRRPKKAMARIADAQRMTRPVKPELLNPYLVFYP